MSGFFSDAWNAIKNVWDTVATYFSGIWDDIKGLFSDAWDRFTDIGRNIVNGIKNGISAAWDSLVTWFNGIWDSLFGNREANVTVNKTTTGSADGSHAGGLAYVPYDGYIAELHKGERVLTKREAERYGGQGVQNIFHISATVREDADIKKIAQQLYRLQKTDMRGRGMAWA